MSHYRRNLNPCRCDVSADSWDTHRPVMLGEVREALRIAAAGCYLDLTYGRGGHAGAILERLGPQGRLIAMDKDPDAVRAGAARWGADARISIAQGSFALVGQIAARYGVAGRVDGALLDLGVSSPQLDDARRGFSFRQDGPLDMRMDPQAGPSAAQWLAAATEHEIAAVLRSYGEERHAGRIARAIVSARRAAPIETTGRLAAIVAQASPRREPGKDPATRTFQAIRIFVNHELEDLQACLADVVEVLAPHGRLVVISFHSLEDRIVKRFIRREARGDAYPAGVPVRDAARRPRLRAVGRAARPEQREIAANPRARSAVMRVAERLH